MYPRLYSCPGCGEPDSAWDDGMCGNCERNYNKERQRFEEDERRKISKELNGCKCPEGECYRCRVRIARLAELDGDYEKVDMIMNY